MSTAWRIGVDVGGSKIEAAALNLDGRVASRLRRPTPSASPTPYADTIAVIRDLVEAVEAEIGAAGLAVGIGAPGSAHPDTRRMRNANSVWLNGQAFEADLFAALKRPIRLANDADCFTLSEAVDGAARDGRVVFGVILGTGVGGGVAVNRRLLSGASRITGEWGHNPLPWPGADELPGPTCWCGKSGCLETWLSGPGWTAEFERRHGLKLTAEDLYAWSEVGGPNQAAADLALARYADRLARGLAGVINILDPDVIVFGGGLSAMAAIYRLTETRLAAYVFSDVIRTRLVPNAHGDSSGVRGAAWLWPWEDA